MYILSAPSETFYEDYLFYLLNNIHKLLLSSKWRKKNFIAESYSNYIDMEIEEKDPGSGEETDQADEPPCALWGRVRVLVLYFYLNFNIYFLIQTLLKYISEILNNPNNRVLLQCGEYFKIPDKGVMERTTGSTLDVVQEWVNWEKHHLKIILTACVQWT